VKKLILYALAAAIALLATQAFAVSTSYTLSSGANTSAGVYDSNGVLIRTLWNNVHRDAGTYAADWNGLDDNGILRPNGSYQIRVLSNNVQYAWDGVVGNTSTNQTDPSLHHGLDIIHGMAVSGSTIYFVVSYNEQLTSSFKTSVANPQSRTPILTKGASATFVATDDTNVYWAARDVYVSESGFVYVTAVSNDAEVIPTNSTSVATTIGRVFPGAVNYVTGTGSAITGLAVQKSGNFLFVARRALNRLDVINKTTGALVRSVTVSNPTALTVDATDNLWMVTSATTVGQYSLDGSGNLTQLATITSGLSKALALAVSPNGSTLLVADGGTSQQIKAYDITSAPAATWTFGQAGGYAASANVSNDRFYLRHPKPNNGLPEADWTFLAYQPDGNFWVGDMGNYRSQRYDSSRNFVDRIQYMPAFYSAYVDQNDRTRVFADFLEFSIDYSRTLAPNNGSWTLVKNWGWGVPSNYTDGFTLLRSVTTLANGRTYALLRNYSPPIDGHVVVELPASGTLQFTGVQTSDTNWWIAKDGSLRHVNAVWGDCTSPLVWSKRNVSFDGSNNAVWGTATNVVSSPSRTSEDPCISLNNWSLRPWEVTSTGVLLVFAEYPTPDDSWHLQGLDVSTGQWKWRSARSTNPNYWGLYPTDGSFDTGNTVNNYAGGASLATGRNVFWQYHGEFWKQAQTNMWTHLYDDGLMVGQFGVAPHNFQGPFSVPDGTPGAAGNAFCGSVVTAPDGTLYIYQNDESRHGGIHRWHVTGLDTIHEDTASVTLANTLQTGLSATYFDTAELSNVKVASTRLDSDVNFSWGTGIPSGTSLSHADEFSVRWQGFIKPQYSQTYTIYANVSDGVRVWIGKELVVDAWWDQTTTEQSGDIKLQADTLYPITVEYYERTGDATAQLSWSSASQSKQTVPSSRLFYVDTSTPISGTNLHEGLRRDADTVADGLYGWHRTPANDSAQWTLAKNKLSYRWDKPVDIVAAFSRFDNEASLSRDLLPAGAGTSSTWSLKGSIAYRWEPGVQDYNVVQSGGSYLEVLDDAGKVIARLNQKRDWFYTVVQMFGNGTSLFGVPPATWAVDYDGQLLPFEISAASGQVTFKAGTAAPQTVSVSDPTSNWQKPRTLRLRFWTNSNNYGREVNLDQLTFSSTP